MSKYFCFLHGTTCRQDEYTNSVTTLKNSVLQNFEEINCYWGGTFGANLAVDEEYGLLTDAIRAVTEAASPSIQEFVLRFVADVMKYQAASDRILGYLEGILQQQLDENSQLLIIGHSLGAIIAADLVCTARFPCKVGLVTVGSLIGPLYKLECLKYFNPQHSMLCKLWMNIHDGADLLSSDFPVVASLEPKLERRSIDQGTAFPACHSKYFEHNHFQLELGQFLERL